MSEPKDNISKGSQKAIQDMWPGLEELQQQLIPLSKVEGIEVFFRVIAADTPLNSLVWAPGNSSLPLRLTYSLLQQGKKLVGIVDCDDSSLESVLKLAKPLGDLRQLAFRSPKSNDDWLLARITTTRIL
jgi:hypothetical protein